MKIKKYMEDFIRTNYMTMTQKEIAKSLGENVTASDVQYWLKKNNLWKQKYMFSQESIDFMINNYKTMEYSEIAKRLGLTERQVRGKLNNMGYTKLREFNKNYFHYIDSDLKAYFLGFIFADGWVIYDEKSRTYELGIELQSEDKYILDEINNAIGGVHKITHLNPTKKEICGNVANCGHADKLRVYSKNIVKDLISHGVTPNKTYNYEIPNFPMEYFFDFLRGYIDGDGCYHLIKRTENTSKCVVMSLVCASCHVLEWIQRILLDYDIVTHIYKDSSKNELYTLSCSNKSGMKTLVNLLYHDKYSLCLSRKYNKIKHLLNGLPA